MKRILHKLERLSSLNKTNKQAVIIITIIINIIDSSSSVWISYQQTGETIRKILHIASKGKAQERNWDSSDSRTKQSPKKQSYYNRN